jgi:LEA14-like dessication related protein
MDMKNKLEEHKYSITAGFGIVLLASIFIFTVLPYIPGLMMYLGIDSGFIVQPLEIDIEKASVEDFNVITQEVNLTLNGSVTNPNDFAAEAGRINYTIYVDDMKVSNYAYEDIGKLKPQETYYLTSESNTDLETLAETGGELANEITKKKPDLTVKGDLVIDIGPFTPEFNINQRLID